jgi:hypothetical protein
MKGIRAAIALGLLFSGGLASSSAWSQTVHIGPRGGVHITPDRPHYGRAPLQRCRVVIERHRNRFGEVVTRRTRVCRR